MYSLSVSPTKNVRKISIQHQSSWCHDPIYEAVKLYWNRFTTNTTVPLRLWLLIILPDIQTSIPSIFSIADSKHTVSVDLTSALALRGDILLKCFLKTRGLHCNRLLFRCQFNTCALKVEEKPDIVNTIVYNKHELDEACHGECGVVGNGPIGKPSARVRDPAEWEDINLAVEWLYNEWVNKVVVVPVSLQSCFRERSWQSRPVLRIMMFFLVFFG